MSWIASLASGVISGVISGAPVPSQPSTTTVKTNTAAQTVVAPRGPGVTIETKINIPPMPKPPEIWPGQPGC